MKKISIFLWLVLVIVIVPINAYAAVDKVITHKEFIDYKYQCTYYEDGTRFLNNLINSNDDDTGEEVWIAGSYFKPREWFLSRKWFEDKHSFKWKNKKD